MGVHRGMSRIVALIRALGVDPVTAARLPLAVPRYVRDYLRYIRARQDPEFPLRLRHLWPALSDFAAHAGSATGHYFHQDLWAARKIHDRRPSSHVDIGSRVDGFVSHLLAFMPVVVVDIRPLTSAVRGLSFFQDDATELGEFLDESVPSLSSLHAAEHFGLGRYSDPIDPRAYWRFAESLQRVLTKRGTLYFSVPIGEQRLEFNAHRVFCPETVLRMFGGLSLESFAFVDDSGAFHDGCLPSDVPPQTKYGCGLFEFTKE